MITQVIIAHSPGFEQFASQVGNLLRDKRVEVESKVVLWGDVPLQLLVDNPQRLALLACYGHTSEDTPAGVLHTARINRVRVLPVQASNTVSPAIFADIKTARFDESGTNWSKGIDAILRALEAA